MTKEQLIEFRKRCGETQREFAERIGVSANTVARWERGERSIPTMLDKHLETVELLSSLNGLMASLEREHKRLNKTHQELRRRKGAIFKDEHLRVWKRMTGFLHSDEAGFDDSRIRQLLQLCHPDRHRNSQAATDATAWLLSLRK